MKLLHDLINFFSSNFCWFNEIINCSSFFVFSFNLFLLYLLWKNNVILLEYNGILVQGDTFYLFFETKNSITLNGNIGVAKSNDKGATWQQLGIALNEDWHLSFPYVFEYLGQVEAQFLILKDNENSFLSIIS